MGACARVVASGLGPSAQQQRCIEVAAPLHDVGKIGVPDRILLKPGKLSDEEFAVMRQHPALGHKILPVGQHPAVLAVFERAQDAFERIFDTF